MGRRRSRNLGVIAALATLGGVASAQTLHSDVKALSGERPVVPGSDSEQEPEEQTRWYGWQTLAADGASMALIATSAVLSREFDHPATPLPATIGLFSYFFAAPFIHQTHDRGGAALGSLGLRFLLPVVGGLTTMATVSCDGGGHAAGAMYCLGSTFGAGALGGAVVASGLDAAFLGRERVTPGAPIISLRMAPLMDVSARPAGASVHGVF
jgi:hypothetical protein